MVLRSVIIGINQYRDDRITDLRWARTDADELASAVSDGIQPSERHVRILLDGEATKTEILKAIGEELPRLQKPDDVVLLYFAGHGSPELAGSPDSTSRYLAAHDTEYDNIFATEIDMERDLARLLERVHKAGVVVFFLDACFSGLAGGRTFRGPHLEKARPPFRHIAPPVSLKELSLGEGRAIIAACKDDQVARERADLRHGLFTYHVLDVLCRPNPDDPIITVTSLYDQVLQRLVEATAGRQVPVLKGELAGVALPRLPRA